MEKVMISHGSGGKITHDLIKDVFYKYLGNDTLKEAEDSAIIEMDGGRTAFTTDSFVVKPLFFPGGDIGKIAICGTVNDLAVCGARPRYITCGFILEEGFLISDLERIVKSMGMWAEKAGVKVVSGDTKVVEKGEADGVFINTAGIGSIKNSERLGVNRIQPGDKVIITGTIGDHGVAVLSKRKGLDFESEIKSDCAPLNKMLNEVLESCGEVRFMRDPTRGGLATTLNEVTGGSNIGILIEEDRIPVSENVKSACELLGLDPIYLANEGKAIIIVGPAGEKEVLSILKDNEYGRDSAVIGEVSGDYPGKVCLKTRYGVTRIVDMLTAEQLPRIC